MMSPIVLLRVSFSCLGSSQSRLSEYCGHGTHDIFSNVISELSEALACAAASASSTRPELSQSHVRHHKSLLLSESLAAIEVQGLYDCRFRIILKGVENLIA